MKIFSYLSVFAIITLGSFKQNDITQNVKEYFTIPGPIEYNSIKYNLSWSSHPSYNYYKQEYLPVNQKAETFTKMILIEAVVGDDNLQEVVKGKIAELDQRKKTDPLVNYQLIENSNKGEYLLDFIISQPGNAKTSIVEWNAYRYLSLKDKSGKKGIILFSYVRRSYGNATTAFLKSLKTERQSDIRNLAAYKIPEVQIKN